MGQACIHCGEDCGKHPVLLDEKPFCCNGCKTVYQILNEKDLSQYYKIADMPGVKVETADFGDKYAYLSNEEIRDKIVDFSDDGVVKVSFFIPAIHCASCIWLLENLHTLHPGILHSNVNFPKKTTYITFREDEISLRNVVELLASIHYIPEITLDSLEKKGESKNNRSVLLKIGIAGFSFMNTMMYNFPEYLPGGELLEDDFRSFFGWLSLGISIPVVFYCASDYFLSAIKGLRYKIVNIDLPIALGIITLFLQSAYDLISGSGIGYLDSLTGLVFFLLIGKWYQGKTYQALSFERDYRSYFPVAVTKIGEAGEESVQIKDLIEEDIIVVRNGELIPADSEIVEGLGRVDYSFVTGEAVPVSKQIGDFIYAGGRQVGSVLKLKVKKEVEQSYLTQLWNQKQRKNQSESILNNTVNKVSQYFTIIILTIAFAAGIYWLINEKSLAIYAFTSVLIIACPCALALTVPFTFGSTMRQFGRREFYIKNANVIESLKEVDTIVFDKTGTITMGQELQVDFEGGDLSTEHQRLIKSLVRQSSHPYSIAIASALQQDDLMDVMDFKELTGLGLTGVVNEQKINIGSHRFITGKESSEFGLRSRVYVLIDDNIIGYFQIENKYREGLREVIEQLAKRYELHLLTGDNEAEKKNLIPIFGEQSRLFFNQSPDDKLEYVRTLKENGKNVLMIGDGLNDAGALNESNIGITIADDVYQFSPACEGILQAGRFKYIHRYIDYAKTSLNVVKISFVISFLYNIVGLYFAVQGILSPIIAAILMPISSVSVVAFATFAIAQTSNRYFKNFES
jgi:P-type Cu+ transporter